MEELLAQLGNSQAISPFGLFADVVCFGLLCDREAYALANCEFVAFFEFLWHGKKFGC